MHPARHSTLVLALGLAVLGASGCHDEPAPARYPGNLGTEDERLLPTAPTAYADDILSGRGNIVEYDPSAPIPPSDTSGDESAKAVEGNSIWARIIKRGLAGGQEPPPGPASGRGGRGGRGAAVPDAQRPSAEDESAIRSAFDAYRLASAEFRLEDALAQLAEDQRSVAQAEAEPRHELGQVLSELKKFAETAPNTAEAASLGLALLPSVRGIGPIRMAGPDRAEAALDPPIPGGPELKYVFERSDEAWLIRDPRVPTPEEAETLAGHYAQAAQKLRETATGLEGGQLDDSAAASTLTQTMQELQRLLTPIQEEILKRASAAP